MGQGSNVLTWSGWCTAICSDYHTSLSLTLGYSVENPSLCMIDYKGLELASNFHHKVSTCSLTVSLATFLAWLTV